MSRETLVPLWKAPSGIRRSRSPFAEQTVGLARIHYAYYADQGEERWGVLTFKGAFAFRFLNERAGGDSRDAFEELNEVVDSGWVQSIRKVVHFEILAPSPPPLRHYRIYFNDDGRYDIIAQSWEHALLAEAPSTGLLRELQTERARALDEKYAPCPCCGTHTVSEPGAYEICRICGWEDDPSQSANPALAGGANELSLNAARAAWATRQAKRP